MVTCTISPTAAVIFALVAGRLGADTHQGIGCTSDQFFCGDGEQCIRGDYTCDGDRDCNDGSDEDVCERDEHGCTNKQFGCSDGSKCIRASYKCDGDNDCGDGSDEIGSLCGAPSGVNVEIIKVGPEEVHQIKRMGVYVKTDQEVRGHPVYEQRVQKLHHKQFLFVGPDRNWRVGPDTNSWRGTGIKNEHTSLLTPPKIGWQRWQDGEWVMDSSIELLELPEVQPEAHPAVAPTGVEGVNPEEDCVLEDRMDYAGNDILGILSGYESKENCAKLCGDTYGCKFWTFVKSSEGCWLKEDRTVKSPSNCPGGASNCISGTMGCAIVDKDVDVEIVNVGSGQVHQIKRMGVYEKTDQKVQGRPVYEQKVQKLNQKQFLFVGPDKSWRVGPDTSSWRGTGLKNEHMSLTPPRTGWKRRQNGKWIMDSSIEVLELDSHSVIDDEVDEEEVNAEAHLPILPPGTEEINAEEEAEEFSLIYELELLDE